LAPAGIRVATGEQCQNRIVFKQLMASKGVHFVQVSYNDRSKYIFVRFQLLLAKKFNLPVCPHAGGVGLCQMVSHLIMFDYISVAGSLEERFCEYSAHLHEHFEDDLPMKSQNYLPPKSPG
jgi:L-fuconate dehydratase